MTPTRLTLRQSTAKRLTLLLVVWQLLCGLAGAAEEPASARQRAYLYQKEFSSVVAVRGWRVSTNQMGKLVAHRLVAPAGMANTGFPGALQAYAWLTVVFRPKSIGRTDCTAILQLYSRLGGGKFQGPYPLDNRGLDGIVRDMLNEAERKVGKKYPEYVSQ